MKLYASNTSPYARKTRLVVLEKGLQEQVETVLLDPFAEDPQLRAANPLHRVPTLVLDDGDSLYDSPVICEYLDSLSPSPRLLPASGPERWVVLRWQALADGILDAAYNSVMERRRPADEQSPGWLDNWQGEIERALAAAEQQRQGLGEDISLAHVALATALGYLDFRLADINWRQRQPALAEWFSVFSERESMRATEPG